jgi:hypothetical protein
MSTERVEADKDIQRFNANSFDSAGVDLTQIDWMLSLTPRERLRVLYEAATSLSRLMGNASSD